MKRRRDCNNCTRCEITLFQSCCLNVPQVVGGDIKKVGGTAPISDPDGVVDLVKVCYCANRRELVA